jgi:16S rRNA (guanine966-N2)-methyltransferase
MRVIAGSARGAPLRVAPDAEIRPTADKLKGAIFSMLEAEAYKREVLPPPDAPDGAMLAGVAWPTVLDLYAGSGALGIEALSRGAAHCTFVDDDPKAIDAVRRNLERTQLADDAEVLRRGTTPPGRFDVALLDPPYGTTDDAWRTLLETIDAALVVTESDRELDLGPRWATVRSKRYGSTVVQIAQSTTEGSA